jgi:hypothetical protein
MCLLAACGVAHAAAPSASGDGDEECIFDQQEQKAAYLALEKKYPGSRYVEDQYKLIIPGSGHKITLRRGGCVHFGVSIELRTPRTKQYEDDDVFFSTIMDLAKEYGQGLIDLEKLAQSIQEKNWSESKLDESVYYFLAYPDVAAFEIYRKHDHQHTTIGISFYQ